MPSVTLPDHLGIDGPVRRVEECDSSAITVVFFDAHGHGLSIEEAGEVVGGCFAKGLTALGRVNGGESDPEGLVVLIGLNQDGIAIGDRNHADGRALGRRWKDGGGRVDPIYRYRTCGELSRPPRRQRRP